MKLGHSLLVFIFVFAGVTESTWAQDQSQDSSALEEVIVTATKRAVSEMDTPLSMEVVSGESIAEYNILNLEEMTARIPSVVIGGNIQTNSINIRGMGSGTHRMFEQSVAMFIDEVYLPRSKSYRAPFFDIARAEVLRGPQAVLFGINATAGTINIHTATTLPGDESFTELSGAYEIEYSGYRASLIKSGTLGDSLGVRLALRYTDQQDGYFTNLATGEDENTNEELIARLTLAWEANDNLMVTTKINYADAKEAGDIGENVLSDAVGAATVIGAYIDDAFDWNRYVTDGASSAITDMEPGFDHELLTASVKFDWSVGDNTLTAVASYAENDFVQVRNTHAFASDVNGPTGGYNVLLNAAAAAGLGQTLADIFVPVYGPGIGTDAQGVYYQEEFDKTALEVRWASSTDNKVSYIVGAYADQSSLINNSKALNGVLLSGWEPGLMNFLVTQTVQPTYGTAQRLHEKLDTDTLSAFGSLTWNISDTFRLTLGARYNKVDKDVYIGSLDQGCGAFTSYDQATGTYGGEVSMVWLYDAGLIQSQCLVGSEPRSDTFSSNNLMPELIASWDFSENSTVYAKIGESAKSGGGLISTTLDDRLDDEIAQGAEIGLKSRFNGGKGQFAIALFHTEFQDLQVTSFISEPGQPVRSVIGNAAESVSKGVELELNYLLADWLTVGTSLGYLDSTYTDFEAGPCHRLAGGQFCDLTGMDTPFAPEYSGSVHADLNIPMGENLVVTGGLTVSFKDSYYTNGALDPLGQQSEYEMYDAHLGLTSASNTWSVSVVGKNLTNEAVLAGGTPFLGYIGVIGAPRTVSVQGTYRF